MSLDELPAAAQSRVGAQIGSYRIDALIGLGGMGAVFAATHRDGTRVAMKLLHREFSQHADIRARFAREGYVANRIGHPAVVRILDDGVDSDGSAYLVMELLAGTTLEGLRWTRGGRLSSGEGVRVIVQLLDVLAAAHRAGVVHRDVKPDNVFIQTDGSLKLMDFGIARLLDVPGGTRTGAIMGTPAFMAPEQAKGLTKHADPRSDIWSVGAVLFLVLTGEDVHPAPTPLMQMLYAGTRPARSVATAGPSLAMDLVTVVDAALAFNPKDRWQSADAMRDALSDVAARFDRGVPPTVRQHLEIVTNDAASASTELMGSNQSLGGKRGL